MKIIRHTVDGTFLAADDKYELETKMDAAEWATCDCEDVSRHPALRRALRKLDELPDKPFAAQEVGA